ncbi:MAG TPA: zf-HC2 domain-containing protein [Terriglobales bacterium]|jgi:hypothetical protein|nr:zf-HC2 domain-containing protein [Terriglobales bacterium]
MSDVPKIVQDRLREAQPREAHPDADVLTAFAEQALPGAEREGVVRHLARCGDCREILALSIPPSAEAAQPAAQDEMFARKRANRTQSWLAWPNLRWAALAASVVVVASVLLINPAKQAQPTDATLSQPPANPSANKDPVQPASESANSVAPLPSQYSGSLTGFQAKADHAPRMKSPIVRGNERRDESRDEPRGELRAAATPAEADKDSTSSAVGAREVQPGDKGSFYYSTQKVAPQQPPSPTARAGLVPSATVGGPTQTVEVAGASPVIETETAQVGSVAGGASSAPAVSKAKEPLKDEAERKAQTQDGLAKNSLASAYGMSDSALTLQKELAKKSKLVPAQWSLAQGRLQRSLDGGTTWQIALQLQQPLLAFAARGNDVWTGGHSGTLFHSTDAGASWALIQPSTTQPSTKAEALTADIVAIETRSSTDIVLSTSTNETWTTADGGKTWDKK